MKTFSNIIKADFYKIKFSKWVWILPIVYFSLILITYGIFYWISKLDLSELMDDPEYSNMIISLTKKTYLVTAPNSSNFCMGFVVVAAIFITREFKSGITKLRISRGNNKVELFFSKFIILTGVTIVYTIGMYILSAILNLCFFGVLDFSSTEIWRVFRSLLLSCLVNVSIVSLAMMVSYLIRNIGGSIAVNIAIVLVQSVLLALGMMVEENHPVQYAMEALPANLVSSCGSLGEYNPTMLTLIIVVPIFVITVSIIVSCLTFKSRDVK